MRLTRFQIKNYKVIDETKPIPVDENVTALLGKNESGKTAIARALWKTNNVAGEEFDKLLDYPRGRYARERKGEQEVTALEFVLSEDESRELGEQFPFDLDKPIKTVRYRTLYVGEEEVRRVVEFDDRTEQRCCSGIGDARKALEAVADELGRHVGVGDRTIADARQTALEQLDAKTVVWGNTNRSALAAFKAAVDAWVAQSEDRAPVAVQQRQEFDGIVAEASKGDPAAGARNWVRENLPTFIYFDEYGQLETRIHLPTYLREVGEERIHARVRTQRALFEWSGLDPREILDLGKPKQQGEEEEGVQRRLDKRRTLLQSASFSLTGDWIDWWMPETKHKLHISADGDYLVLNVSDTKSEFEIPFEERSHGFQWFFSFYLVFLVESREAHRGAILLLDEPGLHLHLTLQGRLIEFFERVSKENQLIYTTHLPMLVDGEHLDRVRTVYLDDTTTPPNTVVSTDVRAGADRDTLLPLQAAAGYSIAQTLFLGKRSVVVEGVTDYWILKALNSCLAALDRGPRLHEETVLVPAGGTSRMMPLASIMFATTGVEGRRMLVMLDSDREGSQAKRRFTRDLFGDDSRILMLGAALGLEEATVEDLAPRSAYLQAVSQGCGRNVKLSADEEAAATNVSALTMYWERMGWGKFGADEKAAAALALIDQWGKDPAGVPETTLNHAVNLFEAINARFE